MGSIFSFFSGIIALFWGIIALGVTALSVYALILFIKCMKKYLEQ